MDNKNINVQKIILATVATVGLIGIAVVAPNALQIIGQFSKKRKYKGKDQIYYLNRSVKNLTKKGLIRIEIKDGKKFLRLTEKGKEQLAKYELGDL